MTAREIKRLRESLSMTQEEFAELLGVTNFTVCRWEQGHYGMSPACVRIVQLLRESGRLPVSA